MDSYDHFSNMAYFLVIALLLCTFPGGVLSYQGQTIRLERTATQISFPVPFSLTAELSIVNETSTVILDCLVQNRITDSAAPSSGYNLYRCTQLLARKVDLPIMAATSENQATGKKKGNGSGKDGNGNQNTVIYWSEPVFGAVSDSDGNATMCRNMIMNSLQMQDVQYDIRDREKKIVVVSIIHPDSSDESHVVWTSNTGSAYLLENMFWYRLFSIIPMSISYSRISLTLTNKSGNADANGDIHACRDYASVPANTDDNQLTKMIHQNSPPTLIHDLSKMIRSNQSYHNNRYSYMCAPLASDDDDMDENDRWYGRRFASSPHEDYGCCPVANKEEPCTEKRAPMPCLLCFYKVIVYVLWWLVIFPVCLVLPFHSAYERCDQYGNNKQKTGEFYKINSTSSMLFTLVCESVITKTVLYIILVLFAFYQIWAEFGRYDEYLSIPIWVYICLILTLVLIPLIKIGWEACSKDIDIELHRPTKYTNKVIHDTFFGVIILPSYCQIRELMVPVRSAVRLHIIYRMRLLFCDSYWVFCVRDIAMRWTRNKKWAVVLLSPIMIILGFLNTLPLIYLLINFVLLCKNHKVMALLKRRWLGFIIAVVLLAPILIAASYTVLLILFYSTSIVILDISTLPVLVLYLFVLDYIWQNFTRMNKIYTAMIACLVEEHQKMIKGMHKGRLSSIQQGDVYDSDDRILHPSFRRSGMFNRSYRDYIYHLFPSHDKLTKGDKLNLNNNARFSTYSYDSFDSNFNNNARTSFQLPLIDSTSKRSSTQQSPMKTSQPFLLHYDCSTLYINAQFHDDVLGSVLPPSVCTFKVILNVLLLGVGYIFMDYFFRCYAPLVPCCLFILLFLVLALARVLMALRQHNYIFPKELQLQVRAHVERHYVLMYVDWEDIREMDYSVTTEGSVYNEKDLESMGTGDDVPLWPPRISFNLHDKKDKPEYRVAPVARRPVPIHPNHAKPPLPRNDRRDASPIGYVKPSYEAKSPKEQPTDTKKKPTPVYYDRKGTDPKDRRTPEPRDRKTSDPKDRRTPEPRDRRTSDPKERRTPDPKDKRTPERKQPTNRQQKPPSSLPDDPHDNRQKNSLPVTYVQLREKPHQQHPDEPNSAFKPRSTTSLPIIPARPSGRQMGRRGASPGRGISPKRNSRPVTPKIVEPEDLDSPDGDPSQQPVYLIEPRHETQPQNLTAFYTILPAFDQRPSRSPKKTMTLNRDPRSRYTILPALEHRAPSPSSRTATLRRHMKDRYSVPEPIEIPIPDSSNVSDSSFQSVDDRGDRLLGYTTSPDRREQFRQQSKSYETL